MNTLPAPADTTPRGPSARFWRRTAFIAAALCTLIAIIFAAEKWRGRRAWLKCQQELQARGEVLDWTHYVPERVPDDKNFTKTPLLEAVAYQGRVATNTWRALEDAKKPMVWPAWGDADSGHKMDWPQVQHELRQRADVTLLPLPQAPAADALQALQKFEPQLDELRVASLKPLARFDLDRSAPFEEIADINFVAVRHLVQILAYTAYAEVALKRNDKAFTDVRVIHRFSDSLKDEPTLVALMMRVALQGLAMGPFWEGWSEGLWSERDLTAFQELFAKNDLLPEFTRTVRAERAGIDSLLEKYGIQRNELWRVTMRNEKASAGGWGAIRGQVVKLGWKLVPRGWVYQNLVTYNERMQKIITPSLLATPPVVSPAQIEKIRQEMKLPGGTYGRMSETVMPNFFKALEHTTRIQVVLHQAQIVCALERCRQTLGQYPETLSALTPRFLEHVPNDTINGGPMKYRRTNDGKFLLYSVGWNETDDGGDPSEQRNFRQGDWVWRYPVDLKLTQREL